MKRPALLVSLLLASFVALANPQKNSPVPSPAEARTGTPVSWESVPAPVKQRMGTLKSKISNGGGNSKIELPRCARHGSFMHCYIGDYFCTIANNGDGTFSGGCGKL